MVTQHVNMAKVYGLVLLMGMFWACSEKKTTTETQTAKESNTERSAPEKRILFFGNSLTAGYGLEEEEGFPDLIQNRLDSLGYNYTVINGGLSGETTASGLTRLDWFLEDQPHIFILELGGNDGLRGIDPDETRTNLIQMLEKVQARYPDTRLVLAGMQVPPNMGQTYTQAFEKVFPVVADRFEDLVFIPFLLEGVGGDPELNLPDGIHPTAEGHKIVAETVWKYLEPLL